MTEKMAQAQDQGWIFPVEGVRVWPFPVWFCRAVVGQCWPRRSREVYQGEHPGRGEIRARLGMRLGRTETTYYNSMNRNQCGHTPGANPAGSVSMVHDLLPAFTLVIHNFKPRRAEKLGIGYEQLKAIKSRRSSS
ncbi:CoA transferase [Comamonas terrigena]|uniref:CoA transferase n=1 Tax=Comamonas terrigena TaxID=32013 RepID=UPI00187D46BD|nr:CoA transferase [Comamonas terrigena]